MDRITKPSSTVAVALEIGTGLLCGQQLSTKRTLNLEIARRIAAAAEQEARKNNFTMVICVADDGGNVMFIEPLDDVHLGAMPVEGGIPLIADGKIIGAIGVSGGTSPREAQVAQAGVAALEAVLKGGK
jgi:glc operon protein GlcG